MKSKTIELNGNHYDSVTGKLLIAIRDETEQPLSISTHTNKRTINHARAHAPQATRRSSTTAQPIPVASPSAPSNGPFLAVGKNPNHTKARVPQHSVTLRRDAVQKPEPSLRRRLGAKGALQHSSPNLIVTKPSVNTIDEVRLARAKSTERSPHIARHAAPATAVLPQYTSLAVQPVPIKPPEAEPTTPPPTPSNQPLDPVEKQKDIFEHALANAANYIDVHAHLRNHKRKVRNHVMSMAAGTLALIVIAGFAAYQNTPGLQLRVAGMQAGVSTRMPNFAAAGFAYEGVKANDGKLTLGFRDQRGSYRLVQQASNLSSEALLSTIGATEASGKPLYTTITVGNTTVYRFANTDATWVSNGKWYTLSGTSSLSDTAVSNIVRTI